MPPVSGVVGAQGYPVRILVSFPEQCRSLTYSYVPDPHRCLANPRTLKTALNTTFYQINPVNGLRICEYHRLSAEFMPDAG